MAGVHNQPLPRGNVIRSFLCTRDRELVTWESTAQPYRVAEGPRPQNHTRAETRVSCSYSASFCNPPVTGRDGSSAKRGGNHATQGEPLRQWRRWRQNGVLTFTVPIGVTIAAMIRVCWLACPRLWE